MFYKLHTVKSRWSIVYIEGTHVIISKKKKKKKKQQKKKDCPTFSEDQFYLCLMVKIDKG